MEPPMEHPVALMVQPKCSVRLEVTNPDGSSEVYEGPPEDLTLDNMIKLWRGILGPSNTNTVQETLDENDATGTDRGVTVYGTANQISVAVSGVQPQIKLGDGSGSAVTPARTDFKLVNERFSGKSSVPALATNKITCSASFVNGTGGTVTIREAGFALKISALGTARGFLLWHDSTTATAVADGATVTCTYTWEWP